MGKLAKKPESAIFFNNSPTETLLTKFPLISRQLIFCFSPLTQQIKPPFLCMLPKQQKGPKKNSVYIFFSPLNSIPKKTGMEK